MYIVSDVVQGGAVWSLQPAVYDMTQSDRLQEEGVVWPLYPVYDITRSKRFYMQDGAGLYRVWI